MPKKAKPMPNTRLINPQVIRPAEYEIEIDGELLVAMLVETGRLPEDADVFRTYVHVPGGGDYSDTDLDIDALRPIQIGYRKE